MTAPRWRLSQILPAVTLHARESGNPIEVPVAAEQHEVALEHQRRDPQVVGGDGRSRASKVDVDRRIVMRCGCVSE